MFNKIWKDQIVKPKGKLGIWKPKSELKPREEEDRDCCKEAKEAWIADRKPHVTGFEDIGGFSGWSKRMMLTPCPLFKRFLMSNYNGTNEVAIEAGTGPISWEIVQNWNKCEGKPHGARER